MGWEKIVDIANWLKDKLPIQNRLERVKNQIAKLETERVDILKGTPNVKKSMRIITIDCELTRLREYIQNAAPSS